MSEKTFDLVTRVENKPEDCGKRIGYNEIVYGNKYYLLYNGALHKVVIEKMFSSSNKMMIAYINEENEYLGEKEEELYSIDLTQMMPIFYETK